MLIWILASAMATWTCDYQSVGWLMVRNGIYKDGSGRKKYAVNLARNWRRRRGKKLNNGIHFPKLVSTYLTEESAKSNWVMHERQLRSEFLSNHEKSLP